MTENCRISFPLFILCTTFYDVEMKHMTIVCCRIEHVENQYSAMTLIEFARSLFEFLLLLFIFCSINQLRRRFERCLSTSNNFLVFPCVRNDFPFFFVNAKSTEEKKGFQKK